MAGKEEGEDHRPRLASPVISAAAPLSVRFSLRGLLGISDHLVPLLPPCRNPSRYQISD